MTQALVTPEIIRWARERKNLTVDEAAKKIQVNPDKLGAWENAKARPTFRQAKKLAVAFQIPFGYLFLSTPPSEKLPLPDLRTVAGQNLRASSPNLLDVLNDALRKQQWYRGYQVEDGGNSLPSVGRFSIRDDAESIAKDIRRVLGIDHVMRKAFSNWKTFMTSICRRVEDSGILLLQSGFVGNNTRRKLEVDEFRAFAISDGLAPPDIHQHSRCGRCSNVYAGS